MPGPHRRFLNYVSSITSVRDYAMSCPQDHAVRQAYNAAVSMLAVFRDKHIKLVTRYIINQSRKPLQERPNRLNLAVASSAKASTGPEAPQLYGTGGTALIPFLKQTRDETKNAASYC
jgi:indoleamine 2,3-dioxygenase